MRYASPVLLGVLSAATLAFGAASLPSPALAETGSPAATAESRVVALSATVDQVDKAEKMVTLKDSRGGLHDILVGESVNLDKLKVGDVVKATYYEEVALDLHKAGPTPPRSSEKTSSASQDGVTTRQASVTAQVIAVDADNHTITIRPPGEHDHRLQVQDPNLQVQLNKINAGDSVQVTYTQALAVSIVPAKT
jgi:hypothetical protein